MRLVSKDQKDEVLAGRSSLSGGDLLLVGPERRERRQPSEATSITQTQFLVSYFVAMLLVLHCALSVLRLRRLKIATNGKAAAVIANARL